MNPSLYRYSISYSACTITFYLFNLSGEICGFQQYRPLKDSKRSNNPKFSRYFTYLPKGKDGYFGLDLLDRRQKNVYIVEGIFKAAVLHRLGFNSIAVLGNEPKRSRPWFKIMSQTWNLIAIGDNDKAGSRLVKSVGKGFQSPKDLDEMEDEEILQMLGEFE